MNSAASSPHSERRRSYQLYAGAVIAQEYVAEPQYQR